MPSTEVTPTEPDAMTEKILADAPALKPSKPRKPAKAKPEEPKPEPKAEEKPKPKPKPEEQKFNLLDVAQKVAAATKLKDSTAVVTSESGKEARITIPVDGKPVTLAFMRLLSDGRIRVHVQNHRPTPEHRETVESIADAAKLIKQSGRRKPKPKKDEKSAK